MMQRIVLLIALFYGFNAIAQEDEALEYDSNLIGGWEVFSYIQLNNDDTGADTIYVSTDSVYLNLTLIIHADYTIQKWMLPANKSEEIKGIRENGIWNLYEQRNRLWLEIQCEKSGGSDYEIICTSQDELQLLMGHDNGPYLLILKRIDASKP